MSGHSKWSQIKHKKGLTDQKKGQLFSKLSKKISIAAKEGLDPEINYKLKATIEEAKAANMPKDNIERAVNKGAGQDANNLKEIAIQSMGPGSVAIIIKAITDNTNRTMGEIKNILIKNNARLAGEGSLDWMFDKKAIIKASLKKTPNEGLDEINTNLDLGEELELRLIEAGAQEISKTDGILTITGQPDDMGKLLRTLEELNFSTEYSQFELVPKNTVVITEEALKLGLLKLFEELDSHDDVESIFSNAEF